MGATIRRCFTRRDKSCQSLPLILGQPDYVFFITSLNMLLGNVEKELYVGQQSN